MLELSTKVLGAACEKHDCKFWDDWIRGRRRVTRLLFCCAFCALKCFNIPHTVWNDHITLKRSNFSTFTQLFPKFKLQYLERCFSNSYSLWILWCSQFQIKCFSMINLVNSACPNISLISLSIHYNGFFTCKITTDFLSLCLQTYSVFKLNAKYCHLINLR